MRGLTRGEVYVMSVVAVDGEHFAESLPLEVDTSGEGPYIQPKDTVATAGWFIGIIKRLHSSTMWIESLDSINENSSGSA